MDTVIEEGDLTAALSRIGATFADSIEVITAFVSYARSGEVAPELLAYEAECTVAALNRLRHGLRGQ